MKTKKTIRRLKKILVANRGEIAIRALRCCRKLGIESVSVHSDADRNSPHTWIADKTVCIGPPPSSKSYLCADALLHIAVKEGCDGIYPGYGFLSENAAFAEKCGLEGIKFIGPSPETIIEMGNKSRAREVALSFGVPVVPGSASSYENVSDAESATRDIGFPILLKARSGGGGRGMRIVDDPKTFRESFSRASREAESAFADGSIYMERFFPQVRHIEIQVFGNGNGSVLALGERDCSVQRRHQKLIEESPSPVITDGIRSKLVDAACALARGINYEGAGTVEFIFDVLTSEFFFIEMNTRIQVEHPVTEMQSGLDLVSLQFHVAAGGALPDFDIAESPGGHTMEFRINAEDWRNGFTPSPGLLTRWRPPCGVGIRFDSAAYEGYRVPPYYDSMIGKLIVHGVDRDETIRRARDALDWFEVEGIATTIGFHRALLDHPDFLNNKIHTRWVEETPLERP